MAANTISTSELPIDIILHHIAPRLPAKSVLRFMAVSKQFHAFLKTQKFAKMHLRHVINDHHQHHDNILVVSTTYPYKFSIMDYEAVDDDDPPIRRVPSRAEGKIILSCFHGLVCVGYPLIIDGFMDLALWNPVTGACKILSATNFRRPFDTTFELYYTSCDDDYKLLHVTRHGEVYVYSLRSDSWRKLQVEYSTSKLSHTETLQGVWLNENLYFLKVEFPLSLIRFDPKTERLSEITTPSSLQVLLHRVRNASLFVHKGSIHLCAQYVETRGRCVKSETWRMNGNGDWSNGDIPGVEMSCVKEEYTDSWVFGDQPSERYTATLVSPKMYKKK